MHSNGIATHVGVRIGVFVRGTAVVVVRGDSVLEYDRQFLQDDITLLLKHFVDNLDGCHMVRMGLGYAPIGKVCRLQQ